MSSPQQRAQWAFETEYRAEQNRRAELEGLQRAVDELQAEVDRWRGLAIELVRNGSTLPREG